MPQSPFDPSKAVLFDLSQGLVHLDDAPSRVLVPADALSALAAAAGPGATSAFAKALGEPLGVRIARRLSAEAASGEGTRAASVETVVDHLGGELALAGLGSLSLERWGRALILVVDQSPLRGEGEALLGGVLDAALERATGRKVCCARLMRDGVRVRFLVANAQAAERVQRWLGEGVSWGEVLARLHVPSEKQGDA